MPFSQSLQSKIIRIWDASTITSVSDGGFPATWTDTVIGDVATAVTNDRRWQPIYHANAFGPRPGVEFTDAGRAASQFVTSGFQTSATVTGVVAAFALVKCDTSAELIGGYSAGAVFDLGQLFVGAADGSGFIGGEDASVFLKTTTWTNLTTIGYEDGVNVGCALNRRTYPYAAGVVLSSPATVDYLGTTQYSSSNCTVGVIVLLNETPTSGDVAELTAYLQNWGPITVQTRPNRLFLFLGDSLTSQDASSTPSSYNATYPGLVARYANLNNLTWQNLGQYGTGVSNCLSIAQNAATTALACSYVEKHVFVFIGTNDLVGGTDPATVAATLQTICTTLRSAGATKLTLCTIPDRSSSGGISQSAYNAARATYNNLIIGMVGTYCNNVVRLDLNPFLGPNGAHTNATYFTDEIHFTAAGIAEQASTVESQAFSVIAATPTTVERGEPGQSMTLSGTGIDLGTAIASDFTLTGSTVTAYNQSTHVLTFTASSSTGTLTLTHVPTGATCILTCVDTTPPPAPSGVTGGTATLSGNIYSFTLSWNTQTDTYGGSVTYRVYKNGTELTTAPGQSGHTYSITGAHPLDVFTVKAEDASGNISGSTAYTFQIPFPSNINLTTYPTITVAGSNLGTVSQIDQSQYVFTSEQNITGPVTVTLASPYVNSEIRYTLNGKNPTPHSHLYSVPVVFSQNASGSEHTAIKARIYDKGNANNKSKIIRLDFRVH